MQDHYLPMVRGTLYSLLPNAILCDINHNIAPGNLAQAQFIFNNSFLSFPSGTVHLVLVTELPKSGRWLAAQVKNQFIVVADNGFLSILNQRAKDGQVVEINLARENKLFPGRDIMAKAACHLARGGTLSMIGKETQQWLKRTLPNYFYEPDRNRLVGNVSHVDNFGNVITNITRHAIEQNAAGRDVQINLPGQQTLNQILEGYAMARPGEIIAIYTTEGFLQLALVDPRGKEYNGANTMLGLQENSAITVNFI
jgi:S-adenosylmethionine hydrolase